jgi:hypothetical protein
MDENYQHIKYLSKKKKDSDPGGTHRFKDRVHIAHKYVYSVRAKSKAMKKPAHKEETGKQILARIMRELWANIERKEKHKSP